MGNDRVLPEILAKTENAIHGNSNIFALTSSLSIQDAINPKLMFFILK